MFRLPEPNQRLRSLLSFETKKDITMNIDQLVKDALEGLRIEQNFDPAQCDSFAQAVSIIHQYITLQGERIHIAQVENAFLEVMDDETKQSRMMAELTDELFRRRTR